jgi:hypothetical protein
MGMSDPKVVPIRAHLQPSRKMRRMAQAVHGASFASSMNSMLNDAAIVNAVAGAMERALQAGTNKDGKVDMREAAMHLIAEMRRNQL